MRPMPPVGKITLVVTTVILVAVFTVLYMTRAAALTAEERWKALPIEEKRQEWAAQCIVDSLPADPFIEGDMASNVVASCTDSALLLFPEAVIE